MQARRFSGGYAERGARLIGPSFFSLSRPGRDDVMQARRFNGGYAGRGARLIGLQQGGGVAEGVRCAEGAMTNDEVRMTNGMQSSL